MLQSYDAYGIDSLMYINARVIIVPQVHVSGQGESNESWWYFTQQSATGQKSYRRNWVNI